MATTSDDDRPRRLRWWVAGGMALLALAATAYLVRGRGGNPEKVQKLQQQLFTEAARAAPPEQRRTMMAEFRDEVRRLSPEQRAEFIMAGQREMKARFDQYFAMAPADKRKHLDQIIDRMQQQPAGGRGGPPGGFGMGPPGGRGGPGGGPPGANSRPQTPEAIEQRRRERLDRTTPEQRALTDQIRTQMDKFRKDLNDRRTQRGMPALPPRGNRGMG